MPSDQIDLYSSVGLVFLATLAPSFHKGDPIFFYELTVLNIMSLLGLGT
jgi:hypothetical protein